MSHSLASRRALLLSSLAATALVGIGRRGLAADALPATPMCDDGAETPPQTEGPFYTPDTPLKADFTEDGEGAPLLLSGFVLSTACRPQAGAVVDLWHCDAAGRYDTGGYRFRGHQLTDGDGRFAFRTIVPAVYPGRTRHYHVKVQAPGSRLLTSQLYFPGEPANDRDRIYDPRLLMATQPGDNEILARFDFVLEVG